MVWYTSHVIADIVIVYDVTPDANIWLHSKQTHTHIWLAIQFLNEKTSSSTQIHEKTNAPKKNRARDSSGDSFCSSIERPALVVGDLTSTPHTIMHSCDT
jgi:hypothetical protein